MRIYRVLIGLSVLVLLSCTPKEKSMQMIIEADWSFYFPDSNKWYPAQVPGCIHTDLLNNKLIKDPFYRFNENELQWIETKDWEYQCEFKVAGSVLDKDSIQLVFEGLDTYADVYLNDSLLLKADNMFIAYVVPCKSLLKDKNKLRVKFISARNIGMAKLKQLPYTLMAANEIAPENERTNVFTRKAPFHYGWDWGPRFVTSGIWKNIKINAWSVLKIEDIYFKPVEVSSEKASYKAEVELLANKVEDIKIKLELDNKLLFQKDVTTQIGINIFELDVLILNPELWWTNGLGKQKLYNAVLRVYNEGTLIAEMKRNLGVRSLELVQEPDSIGHSFYFKLNGVPVFMKGSNYIPDEIFTTLVDKKRYEKTIQNALDVNMNMLRVWGGAIYESNEFYDLCDQKGILIWNDFMFACSVQPVDSSHLNNIKKEAEYNVKRLRRHTSVALWCGNNENLRAWHEWGWKQKYPKEIEEKLWKGYEKIFYDILPAAVNKYQADISYWPSSPQSFGNKLTDRMSGDEHDWSVWFSDVPFTSYAYKVPRFVSEYGLQSFPDMKTIKAFASDSDLQYRSPVMEHRQRSKMPWLGENVNGNEVMLRYIKMYYNEPDSFSEFVYLSQIMQAEGVRFAVETHRRNMPHCMGSLYWQLNDCWPTMSWAGVDYFGRWKALHYYLKKVYAPLLLSTIKEKEKINFYIVNDQLDTTTGIFTVKLFDFYGKELWSHAEEIDVLPNQSKVYYNVPESELLKYSTVSDAHLVVSFSKNKNVIANDIFYFTEIKNLKLPEAQSLKVEMIKKQGSLYLKISSDVLLKNLFIFHPTQDIVLEDNYMDILPGIDYYIQIKNKSIKKLNVEDLQFKGIDNFVK